MRQYGSSLLTPQQLNDMLVHMANQLRFQHVYKQYVLRTQSPPKPPPSPCNKSNPNTHSKSATTAVQKPKDIGKNSK